MVSNKILFTSNFSQIRAFVIDVLLFGGLFVMYCLVNLGINSALASGDVDSVDADFLVVGDSHSMFAVNDSLLTNAQNISQSAEPLVLTYWKLCRLLQTESFDHVILSLSYNTFSGYNDEKFVNPRWSSEMMRRCYSILQWDDLDYVKFDFSEYTKTFFRNMCLVPRDHHFTYIGHYSHVNKSKLSNLEATIKRQYFLDDDEAPVSESSLHFLNLIVDLLRKHEIELTVIRTPVHPSYRSSVPERFKVALDDVLSNLILEGIQVLDFDDLPFGDRDFYDFDHLNAYGASIYTDALNSKLLN